MAYPHVISDQRHSSSLLISILNLLCYTGGNGLAVETSVGDDAVLPCEVDPCEIDAETVATDLAVYWTRPDLPPNQYVHFQRDGKEGITSQNPIYKGRTSLFMDELKNGNMSLKLSRVNSSDEGNYTCFIPEIKKEFTIQLIVGCDIPGHESTTKVPDDMLLQDGDVEEAIGHFPWWVIVIIIPIIISTITVLVYKRQSRFRRSVIPADSKDLPYSLKVVDGTSIPLMPHLSAALPSLAELQCSN